MKILVLSDIHDHVWSLKHLLASDIVKDTEALICCGDLCAPFVIPILGQYQQGPVHVVFGNNDADTWRMTAIASAKFPEKVYLHGEYAQLQLGGKSIAVNHFHHIAEDLAASGRYDWVLYGHNHLAADRLVSGGEGHSRLLNPGTLMGMALGPDGPYRVPPTVAVVDLGTQSVSWYQVDPHGSAVTPWELS